MTEPGAVSGTISQSNAQGLYSNTHYPTFTVNSSGTDTIPGSIPSGGVGFSNSGVVDSKDGSGALGENDDVSGDTFGQQQVSMGEHMFSTDNLVDSPYYSYHTNNLSKGNAPLDQTYHPSRSLGRGMNMDDIRSRVYYDSSEVNIFTWNLPGTTTNVPKETILKENLEKIHDV